MNKEQERHLRKQLKSTEPIQLPLSAEHLLLDLYTYILNWLCDQKSANEDHLLLSFKPFSNAFVNYLIIRTLRSSFKTIWVELFENNILITKVSNEERLNYEKVSLEEEEAIVQFLKGFSRIFCDLVTARKPLIGNNMLNDLMMLYHHFHSPLPSTFTF